MDSPLVRSRAIQVAHSLNVAAELPRYVDDGAFPFGLRVAAIDAFFIHLRLLIEFLIKQPDIRHPAIHRDDYARGFHLGSVDSDLYQRLDADYGLASQRVVHFNIERVPDEGSPGIEWVDAAPSSRARRRCLDAMRAFVGHMKVNGSAYADDFDRWLSSAEGGRRQARAPPES
jgi:hypothetical protein